MRSARSEISPEKPAPNDQGLAERVKSELFRPADAPKGSVNVNVEGGIVFLRGEVDATQEQEKLVEAAARVDGVKGVESLLHSPGDPAEAKNGRASGARA